MELNISSELPGKLLFAGYELILYCEYNENLHPLIVDGHLSLFIKTVLEKFNWNYDGKVFDTYGDVTGEGMLGSVATNESDVSFAPIEARFEHFRYVDYSSVTIDLNVFIVSSDNSAVFESSAFAFVSIYSSRVWLAWVVTFFLFSVFWSLAENILSRYSAFPRNGGLTRKLQDTYKMTLNLGITLPPYGFGHLRLAVGCWILGCFVLNAAFTGGLLSKLTLPPKPTYIETYEDILKHPNLRVLVFKDTTIHRILKGSTDNVRSQIWQRVLRFDSVVDWKEWDMGDSLDQISRGEMVLLLEKELIMEVWPILIECDQIKLIHISEASVWKHQLLFLMRKNLEPRKAAIFKRIVESLFETRITWRTLWFAHWQNRRCFVRDPIPLKKLDWSSIRVVCFGLLLGYLISAVALILQLKYHPGI